ncbi:hypothetical protein DVH24_026715 [Malus domestica]|uniref:Uncharacterized protein n=1 Tax=Malus domestica TaxID=3750 RepID=A0A498K8K6_MALDO|nr:hypothetical protein DVH24_026715 [Malus domestica]
MGWEKRRIEVAETLACLNYLALKFTTVGSDIEESRVAISITKGNGSKLKKGRAKRGVDDLEKRLCLLNDIAYNGDDEHEAKDGPLNVDNEGDETKEVNEGAEIEANEVSVNANAIWASTSKALQPSQSSQPCTHEAPQPSSQPTQVSQTTSKSIARDLE